MITISLCMIVRDEEAVLERCLQSASGIWDELIIVDTGSADSTKEIAARYTDQVYDFQWIDDFSAARNFSFSKAGMEYCLWLDADDVLSQENKSKFLELKKTLSTDIDVVMMRYNTAFDESGAPIFSYYRERLIRNLADWRWKGRVHEAIVPKGNVLYSEISIEHRKLGEGDRNRNLRIYEKQIAAGTALSPREQYYYGRELFAHGKTEEAVHVFETFLNERDAWLENKIDACRQLANCLFALNRKEEGVQALFRSFAYSLPRAEICCDIGRYFLQENCLEEAAYWYESALQSKQNPRTGGFTEPDSSGYLPAIQLCVCYDRMGEYQKAYECNELAGQYRPDSAAYQHNKRYFEMSHKGGEEAHG